MSGAAVYVPGSYPLSFSAGYDVPWPSQKLRIILLQFEEDFDIIMVLKGPALADGRLMWGITAYVYGGISCEKREKGFKMLCGFNANCWLSRRSRCIYPACIRPRYHRLGRPKDAERTIDVNGFVFAFGCNFFNFFLDLSVGLWLL